MRLIRGFLFFVCLPAALSAAVTDFQLTALPGPHHVVRWHYLTFNVNTVTIAGVDDEGAVPSTTGAPSGITVAFPTLSRFCCGDHIYRVGGELPVVVTATSTAPIGTFTLQVSYKTTSSGITRSVPYTITVDPIPAVITPTPVTSVPPLKGYSKWLSNAKTYGKQHCNATEVAQGMYGVDYYDGTLFYYQIADITGDSFFNTCAAMVYQTYLKYVTSNNGKLPGYYVFGDGFQMTFKRTGDQAAKQALGLLVSGGLYTNGSDPTNFTHNGASREYAYAVDVNILDQSVGTAATPHFQDLVEAVIGHFDEWFVSKTVTPAQPFMVALSAEALIAYWDQTKDPRVPPILQLAADQIWVSSWTSACGCFAYYNDDGTSGATSQDLNLLIAPLYGWVFKQTGNLTYLTRGDQVFNGGVAGAYLDGGKQFSQAYRWSGKYVEWRGGSGKR